MLQQYLPFTVLKLFFIKRIKPVDEVATVLTVYGIETCEKHTTSVRMAQFGWLQQYLPFTVLKPITDF